MRPVECNVRFVALSCLYKELSRSLQQDHKLPNKLLEFELQKLCDILALFGAILCTNTIVIMTMLTPFFFLILAVNDFFSIIEQIASVFN